MKASPLIELIFGIGHVHGIEGLPSNLRFTVTRPFHRTKEAAVANFNSLDIAVLIDEYVPNDADILIACTHNFGALQF